MRMTSGLTVIDLVFYTPDVSYLIEIKTGRSTDRRTSKKQHGRMMQQLMLAHHFMHRNFDTNIVLIGVKYATDPDREKIAYTQVDLDPKSQEMKPTNRPSWRRLL